MKQQSATSCRHHWLVEAQSKSGDTFHSKCRECGEERDFQPYKLEDDPALLKKWQAKQDKVKRPNRLLEPLESTR